ncbi:antitoxin YezG family protein [Priestia megaterium]|uniref:antitoxin YezG family protein n=1 Tax=Priestia megaterium TaxID=1404 RepID=UPI0039E855D8
MNEEKLNNLYQDIANIAIETIPKEWSEVYLYGEVVEGAQTAYFYYHPNDSDEIIYSHDIPEIFPVSEEEYSKQWNELLDCIQELWKVFIENEMQEPWTNFTLVFDNKGKFNIQFNYDDLSTADSYARKTIWKYEYLGVLPKSKLGKKHLERYLEAVKDN